MTVRELAGLLRQIADAGYGDSPVGVITGDGAADGLEGCAFSVHTVGPADVAGLTRPVVLLDVTG